MVAYSRDLLMHELAQDEGVRLKPYTDTVGKLTVGIGRNLTDKGISRAEADQLCLHDIADAEQELDIQFSWWRDQTDARQRILLNMVFNLGIAKFAAFQKMRAAMQLGDFDQAAVEMLNSAWASQVGARAQRLAQMMRDG